MTLPVLPQNIRLISQYENITDVLEYDLELTARNHIIKFEESYFKKILKKDDAEISIHMHFAKNKQDKYEGKFKFIMDTEEFYWDNDVPFKEPLDVVNHAFKHLKEYLSK